MSFKIEGSRWTKKGREPYFKECESLAGAQMWVDDAKEKGFGGITVTQDTGQVYTVAEVDDVLTEKMAPKPEPESKS